jgi:uncharacterized membrane protein YccC
MLMGADAPVVVFPEVLRMWSGIAQDITDTVLFIVGTVASSFHTFVTACTEVRLDDPAARIATSAVSAAVIATLVAFAMNLDDPWWATVSGYMATQRTGSASLQRAVLRIVGTTAGATVAVATVDWVAYDIPAFCLLIFAICTISIIGNNVSRYGYSWLLVGLTCVLVTLASLGDPSLAPRMAIIRVLEIIIGSTIAAIVSIVLNPAPTVPPVEPPGWSGLLGPKLYITTHAMRWSLAVALIPLIWRYFEITDMTQMAVTVVMVMSTPVAADPGETHRQVLTKGLQRLLGCLIGGVFALLLLGLGFNALLPWLLAWALPLWLCSYVQNGTHSATYVGTQAGFVLILTMVQGNGPPSTLIPGVERFVGIFFGLLIVMLVVQVTHPPSFGHAAAEP